MEKEKIVELVTTEVLRLLEQKSQPDTCYQALVIITGGTIGLETGLEQLKRIQAMGTDLTVVLSQTAEKIIGVDSVKEKLSSDIKVVTAQSCYPKDNLQKADVVLIPVLTQNTAAKIGATITDTMACYLILSALMQNKPVIAAIDAANPGNRSGVQMAKLAPALREALENNLIKIGTYGIKLTTVENLAAEAKKLLIKDCEGHVVINSGKKQVLDAETVRVAAQKGEKIITVPAGTIVTPLALNLARDFKIEIVQYTSI